MEYFNQRQLRNVNCVQISKYNGHKIPYTFTQIQLIDLSKYDNIIPMNMYDTADSYAFRMSSNTERNDVTFRMDINNIRHEWITHLDNVLSKNKQVIEDDEKKAELSAPEQTATWNFKQKSNDSIVKPDDLVLNNSSYFDADDGYEEIKEEELESIQTDDIITSYSPTKQKLINDFVEETKEEEEEYSNHFNFGKHLNYWQQGFENSVDAKYKTLKDELLNNKYCPISEEDYYQLYDQCCQLFKIRGFLIKAQNIGTMNVKCNIPIGSSITINHLIALKVYTDFTKIQQLFKQNCRRYNENESLQNFIERNSQIANWCRYLRESTTFYGTKMKDKYVYTGLKNKLIFSALTQHFYCPLSTTFSLSVAQNYCDDHGVILKLKAAHSKSRCFDVSWLSRYKFEDERLIQGAPLQICDIYIDTVSSKHYIAALQLLDDILNGYEIDTKEIIETQLYLMLGKCLGLHEYDIPEYVGKLLEKILDKMKQKMQHNDSLKRLWINQTGIHRLRNEKLKCLFGCNCFNSSPAAFMWSNKVQSDDRCRLTHLCGQFFRHFGINLNDINKVIRFSWTIDADFQQFKNMKARKYVTSPDIEYYINDKERIVFQMRCYPKYTNESAKCALFLHIQMLPINLESIKVEYDLLCDYGGKSKYRHVMIPQLLTKSKTSCGVQTFSSKRIKYEYLIWNIGIKVIEIKYINDSRLKPDVSDLEFPSQSESYQKNELMDMLKNANNQLINANNQNEMLQHQIQMLMEENRKLKMSKNT